MTRLSAPSQAFTRRSHAEKEDRKLRHSPVDAWPQQSFVCPITDMTIPADMAHNLEWRMKLRKECQLKPQVREGVLALCAQSPIYWISAFGWTYRQRRVEADGRSIPVSGPQAHYPMIPWPIQRDAIEVISDCIAIGKGCNLDKSRDMGASWLVLFIFAHLFLFRTEQNFGVVSRKEVLVDSRGDMDSLFEKLRYIIRQLPPWMIPRMGDRHMMLINMDTNSSIAGESTNANVGRGGRKIAYFVDEGAAIDNGESVDTSLSQNTACQIWASTPLGPGTQFHRRIKEHRGEYIMFPWWRHPEKSQGAHQIYDELGHVRWSSPWYVKLDEFMSAKAKAQEVDMDHGKAGDVFFDAQEVERHRQDYARPPKLVGELLPTRQMTDMQQVEAMTTMEHEAFAMVKGRGRRRWRLWSDLVENRPQQNANYVFGLDISTGAGNSNSVLSVLNAVTGHFVAKFWDAHVSPEDLAVMAAAAGIWFGGEHGCAYIVWENNGPGGIFGRKLVHLGYPRIYMQRQLTTRHADRTKRWGWNSSRQTKEMLLGAYRDAIASDSVIQHCHESLDEAQDYIYTENGALVPSRLRMEPGGGRELHGDHVIADALCVLAREELPRSRPAAHRAPPGTYAYRRDKRRRRDRQLKEESYG
jgi:hypothetical protein